MELDFSKGLVPAVVQDHATGEVLMLAYINDEAWRETLATGRACFWSRSRGMWRKGEESGNYQDVKEILVDCDRDTVILKVVQHGGAACHEGYRSCFFREYQPSAGEWKVTAQKAFDPDRVYHK